MITYEALAIILSVAVLCLVSLVIWSRKETRIRATVFAASFVLIPLIPFLVLTALSHPGYPIMAPRGDITVLGVKLVQDEAIYVWLDGDEPRGFKLPWDNETANNLQGLLDKQREGAIEGFVMRLPDGNYLDYEFQAMPQPPQAPPKTVEQPLMYERTE